MTESGSTRRRQASTAAAAQTATALVDAAEAEFAEHGIDGASLRAVMRRAGTDPGAVHYHFGDRASLAGAVLDRTLVPLNQRRLALLASALAPEPDDSDPAARTEAPAAGTEAPAARVAPPETPVAGRETPVAGRETPAAGRETPVAGRETPVALPVLVDALIRPDFEAAAALAARGQGRARLLAAVYLRPSLFVTELVEARFAPVAVAFAPHLARAAPGVPEATLAWRVRWAVFGLVGSLLAEGLDPSATGDDPALTHAVATLTGALAAPPPTEEVSPP